MLCMRVNRSSKSMAKAKKTVFFCQECGYESPKWMGQCPGCKSWNTFVEETVSPNQTKHQEATGRKKAEPVALSEISLDEEDRIHTGIKELDRVLGGGIVQGSMTLVGGDPGIGKSTLLLQVCRNLADQVSVLYISGEESLKQIKLRAQRIGAFGDRLRLLCETNLDMIRQVIEKEKPTVVVIDSIQTMVISDLSSSAGSVTQVRESTSMFMRTAKNSNIPIIVVGHVNKDGNIAGPKVLEHIVDAVLYFEGDRNMSYRILRAVKNRYGSTNEIGVFEMLDSGLSQVENPSLMLISGRPKNTSGTCIACAMEGTRPILAEVQALVSASSFGNPRRMATGFDYSRMAMLLAVLEKRAGYFFGNMDAYINVIGGLKLDEPATDLSVALALISSLKDVPIRDDVLAFGEIGLGGEIRSVNHCEQRIKEAARLGFKTCIIPRHNFKSVPDKLKKEIEVIGVKNVYEAFANCVD